MSTYEISKSSLLSLKAEILRKQQELSKIRADNETVIRNLKKNPPLEIKNKGLEQRQKNDISEEDEDLLKKSKVALEAKSKLYDKLSKNSANLTDEQIEQNKRYLVRFDRKSSKVPDLPPGDDEDDVDRYPESEDEDLDQNMSKDSDYDPPKDPDEEWVEYVDCLGRTRTCLKKDLEYLISNDKDLKIIVDAKRRERGEKSPTGGEALPPSPPSEEPPSENGISENSELLSNDMRRELLRKQWEKEEEELKNKRDIHYQDILFSEARSHGVGYYGFSKDEEERAKQQEALKKLREDTKEQQKKSQELKAMREKQLAARIKAAKNRKRARMGLPPEEDEPEPTPQKPTEEAQQNEEEASEKSLSEKQAEELRKKHVRPWDIGKEGVSKEHYEYTQEEWVEKRRKERETEFAPPSIYTDKNDDSQGNGSKGGKKEFNRFGSFSGATPSNEDLYNPKKFDNFQKSSRFQNKNDEFHKAEGINPYKTNNSSFATQNFRNKSYRSQMEPVPISNELSSDSDEQDQDSLLNDYRYAMNSEENERGKGVEIAPPPTFDYYGPSDQKRSRREPSVSSNISDSIEAGLRYLREQMERKQSSKGRSEDMFLD